MALSQEQALNRLIEIYHEIKRISDWKALQGCGTIEQVRAVLDRRESLIAEAAGVTEGHAIDPDALPLSMAPRYKTLSSLIKEISAMDQFFMEKIGARRQEILYELRKGGLFQKQALPSYLKQMRALSAAH